MRQRGIAALLGPASFVLLSLLPTPAALAAAQDPPPPSGGQAGPPTLAKDVQRIFDESCISCHDQKKHKAMLDLSAASARQALVDVPSEQVPRIMRLKPGDPEQSYLWHKLQHTAAEGKGMPRALFWSKKLPDEELALIRKWIEAGAPE